MADEGWSYTRTDGLPAPMTHYTTAAESATGLTSTDFQRSLHDGAAASPSSFLADDSHMNWTQAYMGRRAATASFNAFLQFHGDADAGGRFLQFHGDADAGGRFLLDQTPPHVHAHQYDYDVDGTAPVAAAPRSYAGNQCSSSARSCSDMRAAAMMTKPFPQQQLSGFSGSSGNFGLASEPPPILSQVLESKHLKSNTEGVEEACSKVKRSSSVPDSPGAVKKPRIETPSPLPTFKVRKEKLGDRITALQQLVSPFGKTDTASVLHEAIEYIKFLHEQVASLSSPYLRCGRPVQSPQQQGSTKAENGEAKDDLRSRGLCLVPVASTYTVANGTGLEFWHPTFGGTFR